MTIVMTLNALPQGPTKQARTERPLDAITAALAEGAACHDDEGSFPHEHIDLLHRHGLLALTVAYAHGGAGADLLRAREVIEAVAQGHPSTALVLAMHLVQTRLLSEPECRWPSAVRARVLHDVVRRGALLHQLRAEPAAMGPDEMPSTTARQTAAGWRLSGQKIHSTGIEGLRWLLVWACTEEAAPRVGTFLVSRHWPGVSAVRARDSIEPRASASSDVSFDDVAVPQEYAVDLRHPEQWRLAPELTQRLWTTTLTGTVYASRASACTHPDATACTQIANDQRHQALSAAA